MISKMTVPSVLAPDHKADHYSKSKPDIDIGSIFRLYGDAYI